MPKWCGCIGCRNRATTVISRPSRPGTMPVCEDHADGHQEVLADG